MTKTKDDTWLDAAIRAEFQKRDQASGSELRTGTESAIAEIKRSLEAQTAELLKDHKPKTILQFVGDAADRLYNAAAKLSAARPDKITPVSANDMPVTSVSDQSKIRKGDASLLEGKSSVGFKTAEKYLGISERQRQKLMNRGALQTEGGGRNKQILCESLKNYLPPTKKPN